MARNGYDLSSVLPVYHRTGLPAPVAEPGNPVSISDPANAGKMNAPLARLSVVPRIGLFIPNLHELRAKAARAASLSSRPGDEIAVPVVPSSQTSALVRTGDPVFYLSDTRPTPADRHISGAFSCLGGLTANQFENKLCFLGFADGQPGTEQAHGSFMNLFTLNAAGGITTFNTGPYLIRLGDRVAWDAPAIRRDPANPKQFCTINRFVGVPSDKAVAALVPVRKGDFLAKLSAVLNAAAREANSSPDKTDASLGPAVYLPGERMLGPGELYAHPSTHPFQNARRVILSAHLLLGDGGPAPASGNAERDDDGQMIQQANGVVTKRVSSATRPPKSSEKRASAATSAASGTAAESSEASREAPVVDAEQIAALRKKVRWQLDQLRGIHQNYTMYWTQAEESYSQAVGEGNSDKKEVVERRAQRLESEERLRSMARTSGDAIIGFVKDNKSDLRKDLSKLLEQGRVTVSAELKQEGENAKALIDVAVADLQECDKLLKAYQVTARAAANEPENTNTQRTRQAQQRHLDTQNGKAKSSYSEAVSASNQYISSLMLWAINGTVRFESGSDHRVTSAPEKAFPGAQGDGGSSRFADAIKRILDSGNTDNVALPEALNIAYKVAYTARNEEEEEAAGSRGVRGFGSGTVGQSDSPRARKRLSAQSASMRTRPESTAVVEEDGEEAKAPTEEDVVSSSFGGDDESAKRAGKANKQVTEFRKAAYVIMRYLCDVIEGDREKFESRVVGVAMETARPNGRLTLAVIPHLR